MSSYSIYLLMTGLSHIALSLIVLSVCASPPQPVCYSGSHTFSLSSTLLCSFLSFLPFCPYFLSYFLLPFLIFLGFVSVLVCLFWRKVSLVLGYPSTCNSPALSSWGLRLKMCTIAPALYRVFMICFYFTSRIHTLMLTLKPHTTKTERSSDQWEDHVS